MCYSLPTPEDPFLNKRKHQKNRDSAPKVVDNDEPMSDTERRVERALKTKLSNGVKAINNKKSPGPKAQAKIPGSNGQAKSPAPLKKVVWDPNFDQARGGQKEDVAGRAFQEAVSAICEDRDSVGEFERQWWHGCAQGANVLGSGHGTSCIQAYAAGAAPHVANQRRLHGSTRGPSALILVKSKEQAHSVSLCQSWCALIESHILRSFGKTSSIHCHPEQPGFLISMFACMVLNCLYHLLAGS